MIDPRILLNDFASLKANNIDYKDRLLVSQRSHLVTAFHSKICKRLREIRGASEAAGIWLSPADVTYAYKPLKMGLRVANLHDPWESFVDTYDRINKTCAQLFRIEVSDAEREADLETFKELRDILKQNHMVHDTSFLLNQEIRLNKRVLAEDASSSLLDEDHGIYPYTDSFHTVSGSVNTGLGIPDEVLETEIGVMSALTILKKSFLDRINCFPTQIQKESPAHAPIQARLKRDYHLDENEFVFGWLDMNHIQHIERLNMLSSIFVTNLDLLDDFDQFKICTSYKVQSSADSGDTTRIGGRMPATIKEFGEWKAQY